MIILVFETDELYVTGDELNNLECLNTDNFLCNCDEDFIEYECEYESDGNGIAVPTGDAYPVGFKSGDYRLYRPDHVSKIDPCLADLSIFKL